MELNVIGSGSTGNCYSLTDRNGTQLIIEAGVGFGETKRALNYNLTNITGVLLSHEHISDHAKSVEKFLNAGVDVYCSKGTCDNIPYKGKLKPNVVIHGQTFRIGPFIIVPFNVNHDAAEPFGFIIKHNECGVILFATDTKDLAYKFPDIDHWLIESNYSEEILKDEIDKENIQGFLANRIYQNHMSLETCINVLKENNAQNSKTITLIHLSSSNASRELFINEVSRAIGVQPYIAEKGLIINLN